MFPMINAQTLHSLVARDLGWQVGPLRFSVIEAVVLVVSLATALASAAGLWRIGVREDRRTRLEIVRPAAAQREEVGSGGSLWYSGLVARLMATPVVNLLNRERMLSVLTQAGFRGEHHLGVFVACKIGGALAFAGFWWWTSGGLHALYAVPLLRWGTVAGALALGSYAPEVVLARLAARRRLRLEYGFPDALDLLVICTEAGLAMTQGVEEVARVMRHSAPQIAAEFAITAAEFRVLPDRTAALDNMVRRTGIEGLQSLTATLNQSLRFGTSLTESLRVLAGEMRAGRISRIEERAARLPVLMTIPLMIFLMPALMIVILSPVALLIADMVGRTGVGR